MRKAALVLAAVAALVYAGVVMRDKSCHYNVHLVKRIYCTEDE